MRLRAVGLVRELGGRRVLDGVDLEVAAGEIVGVVGPNGAGKSTLFRVLAGVDRADRGRVELDGVDLTAKPLHARARAGLAWLSQGATVVPSLSARENLVLACELSGRAADVDQLLVQAGLGSLGSHRASTLSGGERRRLELARILVLDPKAVLLDEPFASVDPDGRAAVAARVVELAARGLAVVLTDHDRAAILRIAHRHLILEQGVLRPISVLGTDLA